ncbi:MAG: HAMP domain-containing sensor histidine kinase [Bdellovibrionota bacterium]
MLSFVAALVDLQKRREGVARLSSALGAKDLLIFIKDPAVDLFLPAQGFPQTLPDAEDWFSFLGECELKGQCSERLTWPASSDGQQDVFGIATAEGVVFAFADLKKPTSEIERARETLSLLSAILNQERKMEIEMNRSKMFKEQARRAIQLADALHSSRIHIQNALIQTQNAKKSAEDALRVRDEFVSVASHELKTPLTSLSLELQFLKKCLEARAFDERTVTMLHEGIDSGRAQAHRVGVLINTLLDVSRIKSGEIKLDLQTFDLISTVKEIVPLFAVEAEATGSSISMNMRFSSLLIAADKVRVEQALSNLLSNAIKYGAGRPIQVFVGQRDEFAEISVEDQGIGIAPEDHERIFHRYERAVSFRNISGLGLGLYIVRHIVDRHSGKVQVKSNPGMGSRFSIFFPMRPRSE